MTFTPLIFIEMQWPDHIKHEALEIFRMQSEKYCESHDPGVISKVG